MRDPFETYRPICEAVAALLHPLGEVVLHDLASDSVVGIWNGFSSRQVGSPSLVGGDAELDEDRDVYGPYAKASPGGGRIKSVSARLKDADGKAIGLMCINIDTGELEKAARLMDGFLGAMNPKPEALFRHDWQERINQYIQSYMRKNALTLSGLSKEARADMICAMDREGLFDIRNSVPYTARLLDISRATLYTQLREIRKSAPEGSVATENISVRKVEA